MSVPLSGSISSSCENSGINRTQVYERKHQLEKVLQGLELAGPGRPAASVSESQGARDWELREKVLRYRLNFPGAMVIHSSGRATYSNGFIRFVLDLLDEWKGSPEWFRSLRLPADRWRFLTQPSGFGSKRMKNNSMLTSKVDQFFVYRYRQVKILDT